jgi:hypothetical protein
MCVRDCLRARVLMLVRVMYVALELDMNVPDYRSTYATLLRIGVLSVQELCLLGICTKQPPICLDGFYIVSVSRLLPDGLKRGSGMTPAS